MLIKIIIAANVAAIIWHFVPPYNVFDLFALINVVCVGSLLYSLRLNGTTKRTQETIDLQIIFTMLEDFPDTWELYNITK